MVSNKSLDTFSRDGYTVMDMGDMEIWDGADLALVREMFTRLVDGAKLQRIGIDMRSVKYIPSGFFGLLYDWYERGIGIRLYDAKPHVCEMLWFQQFFAENSPGCFELTALESTETLLNRHPAVPGGRVPVPSALDSTDNNDQLPVASLTT